MNHLARRLELTILEKFNQDKRAALRYLQEKCTYYARKADMYYGKPLHEKWRQVYGAYSSAEFAISYWLSLDEEFERDCFDDVIDGGPFYEDSAGYRDEDRWFNE